MDGYEATQILRHDATRYSKAIQEISAIAMTASAIQGDREKCEDAGIDDYTTKPTGKDPLERVIQKWVLKRRATSVPYWLWVSKSDVNPLHQAMLYLKVKLATHIVFLLG